MRTRTVVQSMARLGAEGMEKTTSRAHLATWLSDLILVENGSRESEGGCQTRLEIREDKHTSTKMSFAISGR